MVTPFLVSLVFAIIYRSFVFLVDPVGALLEASPEPAFA